MTLGYTDGKTKIKISLIIFTLLFIGTFTTFELRKVIRGPKIILDCTHIDKKCVKNTIVSTEAIYKLSGITKNIASITIGNRKIYTDSKGIFNESIGLYPGINHITLIAEDRFNKEVKEEISIYYSGDNT